VILFGENVPTVAVARAAIKSLKNAAAAGHQPPLLILVDQEGGDVKRLASLPPALSPAQMGASGSPATTARAQGAKTGRALAKIGVNVDLAPVADVPEHATSFLGTRAFSQSRDVVARGACGFAAGLASAGVASSLKHFPGLGRASGNTDLKPISISASATDLAGDLAAYKRCARAAPMVMVSSASYRALGIDRPAVLERKTYDTLATTGFRGVTISDAFDTPAIANQNRPALTALTAGLDLLLYGVDESGAQRAYTRLLEDARAGRLKQAALQQATQRILAFKKRLARKKS
jgi:beta-N-acetylhexosaminidase